MLKIEDAGLNEVLKRDSGMYRLLCDLYPLHRTINSDDFEKALGIIRSFVGGNFKIRGYEPGEPAFTWFVPYRYHVDEAYIEWNGKRYANFADHPLSVVSYSFPVDRVVTYGELKTHVYTHEALPDEIPWMFKYYQKEWGFCLRHNEWKTFDPKASYRVVIKSRFEKEPFQVGELLIPGKSKEEILWVSDVCHPYQANDSLAGAVVAAQTAKTLRGRYQGHYSIRFLFLPETIGSIVWFARNLKKIKRIKYGMFSEMVGKDNPFRLKLSHQGNTRIDRVAAHVLRRHERHGKAEVIAFKGGHPGNDERVMNGAGIGIPTISLTRWPYPEYHTTADNPSIIKPENLDETLKVFGDIFHILNTDRYPVYQSQGPIFLSRYGLWVDWRENPKLNAALETILQLLDGRHSVFDIAEETELDFAVVTSYLEQFQKHKLIRWSSKPKASKAR